MTDRFKIQITNGEWFEPWTAKHVPMQNDWIERLQIDRYTSHSRLYSGRITERNFDMPSKTLTLHISGAYE